MISIIIPCYNGGEWLEEAIRSTLNQFLHYYTFEDESRVLNYEESLDYEVIVIDDGSTDNSLEIARKFKDKIRIISQVNKGLASARNTGIMNSRGEWILPLDADDVLAENCIIKLTKIIEDTDADVIAPSFKCFGLSDQEIILMESRKLEDFKAGNRLGYCAAIRRSALLGIGGYNPKMVEGYEDLHLWINLLTRGFKITTISDILWLYRTKQESMYTKITPKIHTKLIDQINKDFPEAQLEF